MQSMTVNTYFKALGKLGNIVAETFSFLFMFPSLPPEETLLRKQNLLTRKQTCFPTNPETFCCENNGSHMFPARETFLLINEHAQRTKRRNYALRHISMVA